jgi:hypothetical protein
MLQFRLVFKSFHYLNALETNLKSIITPHNEPNLPYKDRSLGYCLQKHSLLTA